MLFLHPGECRLGEARRIDWLGADIGDGAFAQMRDRPARIALEDFLVGFRRMPVGTKSLLAMGA